jgi:SPP1 family predicted phage head-tail adaptor
MNLFESLLTHDFVIYRRQRESDGQGGWAETWVQIATVSGRLRPVSGAERAVAAQVERHVTHVLYVGADTDIARGDMVQGAGTVVDVLGVREPSHAGHHLEVDCLERQREPVEEGS